MDAVTGTFDGYAEAATIATPNGDFIISYAAGDGNDVVLTTITAFVIPTVGEWGMIILALLTLISGTLIMRKKAFSPVNA